MKYLLLMRRIYKDGRKGIWIVNDEFSFKTTAEDAKSQVCNVLADWEFHITEVPS
jgi:hypothetical protein